MRTTEEGNAIRGMFFGFLIEAAIFGPFILWWLFSR